MAGMCSVRRCRCGKRTGARQHAGQPVGAELRCQPSRCLDQRGKIAAGRDLHALQHVDGILGRDIAGGGWQGADGRPVAAHLNGVSVTPLEPMMTEDAVRYTDRITHIQRLRATAE